MKLSQIEFYSYDVAASLRFAAEVLGWTQVPVALQDQAIIEVAEDSPYGISIRTQKTQKNDLKEGTAGDQSGNPSLTVYFEVDKKLIELREICLTLGAIIHQEPTAVAGYGQVMIVEDMGGLRYGLYEARFEGPRAKVPS
ncbi:MAG: hypothetical protein H7249_02885 [Chitinophagaceae bacterium]|nr:hypothetical protein [Oligoflexus sp.]